MQQDICLKSAAVNPRRSRQSNIFSKMSIARHKIARGNSPLERRDIIGVGLSYRHGTSIGGFLVSEKLWRSCYVIRRIYLHRISHVLLYSDIVFLSIGPFFFYAKEFAAIVIVCRSRNVSDTKICILGGYLIS